FADVRQQQPSEGRRIHAGQGPQFKIAITEHVQIYVAMTCPEHGRIATIGPSGRRSLEQDHASAGSEVGGHCHERGAQCAWIEYVLEYGDAQHQVELSTQIEIREILHLEA